MDIKLKIFVLAGITACFLSQVQGADKYTDGNRPYEFGFSIDGEQHRHEKKDERGLIEGEFGFITADGVYHVTVYATDEEGRFKILSMKNIRVKPYPTYTAKQASTSTRQGHSLELPVSSQKSAPTPVITTTLKPISIERPAKSCSHCSLPTTSTSAPILSSGQPISSNPNQIAKTAFPKFSQGVKSQSAFVSQTNSNSAVPEKEIGSGLPRQNNAQISESPLQQELIPPQISQSFSQQGFGPKQSQPAIINASQGILSPPQNSQNFPQKSTKPVQSALPIPNTQQDLRPRQNQPENINNPQGSLSPPQSSQNFPQQNNGLGQSPPTRLSSPQENLQGPGFNNPLQSLGTPTVPQQQSQAPENSPEKEISDGKIGVNFPNSKISPHSTSDAQYSGENTGAGRENIPSGRTPKRLNAEPIFGSVGTQPNSLQRNSPNSQGAQPPPTKPTLISAQMQIVDKNTDIHRLGPGEREGLPEGITKDHMTRLLYTFNYTVGFHGHFEEGYTDGAKQGYYFITGRNGVRTRVDYIADSTGFHPKISQEVLDLLSDDVPKPETEKEEKYGLKGYEFKWLYYPVEAKGR